ncbi:tetratricopeptide TPR_2 repeat protein [Tolypothrix sp. NIES-4075]|uniref:tetratricopeptide repeat protein n=1 Tax=Tolypothrix sp. NIES-4075 TaxID=2005459 RepID=UPI000B71FF2F|nr:tetratricopeptide repeat protein [Tolypothrix sp. NIES-4075]GAX42639.1 tetratricopeptide TPR_2 repeat protein [Tolypothrix sp. NIES-4075]
MALLASYQNMKFNYQLAPILLGVSITLVQPQITVAQSSAEVAEIGKGITVKIESKNTQGSGVIIKKDNNTYTVLTAAHVLNGRDKYEIITVDGQRYFLNDSKVKKLGNLDLGVVKFTSSQNYNVAKLGNSEQVKEGTTCYVAGFANAPGAIRSSSPYTFTQGKVTANASPQPEDDGYALIYDNNTWEGMSGGPVLNEKGELVAIHGKGYNNAPESYDSNINPSIATGKRKSGFAIPINIFLRISSNSGVNTSVAQTSVVAPKSDDFYVKGSNKYRKADYQGAIQDFTAAIKLNPKSTKAFLDRGNARYQLKDYKQAVADYTQAIQLAPQYSDAFLKRGNAYYSLGNLEQAIADYEATIRLDSNNANAYNNRGRVRIDQGNLQQAIADFNESIRLDPRFAGAFNNRGNARRMLGNLQGVIADFNKALSLNPKYAEAYYNRGLVRYDMGDAQRALADYNESIRFDPNFSLVYVGRGNVRNDLGDKQGAIEDYTQGIRLNPNFVLAYVSRGNIYNDLGDKKKAIEDYTQGISLDPKFASAYDKRGIARALLGDKQGALRDLQQAANLFYQQGNREFYQRTLEKIRLIERYSIGK